MPYQFDPDKMYRMPTHFGPRTGPRRGPDGQKFQNLDTPRGTILSVSFLGNPAQLEALLPPGFALDGEPVLTVSANYMTEIEWLAGRGYNTLGASFPVRFEGEEDQLSGNLLLVLWENLTDPILTGPRGARLLQDLLRVAKPDLSARRIPCQRQLARLQIPRFIRQ